MVSIIVKELNCAVYLVETLLENGYSAQVNILEPERLVRDKTEYKVQFTERSE